jgi:soluble lytic murein transglycosylase-like protein
MSLAALLTLFAAVSQTFGLPPGLLAAICFVESNYDVEAIHVDDGNADSLGVCQVQVQTARAFGFQGPESNLRNPGINSYYAGKYLSYQYSRYHGDLHKTIAAYNAGSWRISGGKVINQKYVDKVWKKWKGAKHEATKRQEVSQDAQRQR